MTTHYTVKVIPPASLSTIDALTELSMGAVALLDEALSEVGLDNTGAELVTSGPYAMIEFESRWNEEEVESFARDFTRHGTGWKVTVEEESDGGDDREAGVTFVVYTGGEYQDYETVLCPSNMSAYIDRLLRAVSAGETGEIVACSTEMAEDFADLRAVRR